MDKEDIKKYCADFILRREADYQDILDAFTKKGVNLLKKIEPTKIKFSYPLKKEESGYLAGALFESTGQETEAIREEMRNRPGILRFMIRCATPAEQPLHFKEKRSDNRIWPGKSQKEGIAAVAEKKADSASPLSAEPAKVKEFRGELSNEDLEKKLEEILK